MQNLSTFTYAVSCYIENVLFYVPPLETSGPFTAQKMKFSIKDFFSKCDQIRRKLRIWSHLLKKSIMENFIFCAVYNLLFTVCVGK